MATFKRSTGNTIKLRIPKDKILPKYIDDLTDFTTERLIYWGGARQWKKLFYSIKGSNYLITT